MKAYGLTQEQLDQDKSDAQLRRLIEAWDELSEWAKYRILWVAMWSAFCNTHKVPGAVQTIGNDFLKLLLTL